MCTEILCISLTQDERDWLERWLTFSATLNLDGCVDFAGRIKVKLEQAFYVGSAK